MTKKTVLHVGCGHYDPKNLHPLFKPREWEEIRLDIDPHVRPDIINSITNMEDVKDGSVDAIWSSHNLEHLYAHDPRFYHARSLSLCQDACEPCFCLR